MKNGFNVTMTCITKGLLFLSLTLLSGNISGIEIRKDLIYTTHRLKDTTIQNKRTHVFQWKKISNQLDTLAFFQKRYFFPAILKNYKNQNGVAPLVKNARLNKYKDYEDSFGTERSQSIPLYFPDERGTPERYGRDGTLVYILKEDPVFFTVKAMSFPGIWNVPKKYVQFIGPVNFKKIVFVDRTNQNLASMEYTDTAWLVRSMVPVTSGVEKPPYKRETPAGIFVLQNQIPEMIFLKDGTNDAGGFAPYASRFTNGAYLHGIPVNYPKIKPVEYSWTLGTTPSSHMCVRNPSSHAKFIYEWAAANETLVIVFD